MKTFKQFISENAVDDTTEELAKRILEDCKHYFDHVGGVDEWLKKYNILSIYRGMNKHINLENINTYHFNVRKNRKPKNTVYPLHKIFDDFFEKKFGIKYRSQALFTFPRIHYARNYGHPFTVFPIGDFKFCWSEEIGDLLMKVNSELLELTGKRTQEINWNKTTNQYERDLVLHYLKKADYREDDLIAAIQSQNEIMIYCDDYWAIPEDHVEIIVETMKIIRNKNVHLR